ncbi:MAG: YncE family protein [Acidobacteriota bacterium]
MRRPAALAAALAAVVVASAAGAEDLARNVPIPGGQKGIGFDDLGFSPSLRRILVPAGRTGALVLLDPVSRSLEVIAGFTARKDFRGGHGEGITSVTEGEGLLFVTDRDTKQLAAVDPATRRVLSRTPLASSPDYVRFVAATREIWVTEPDADRIEIFRLREPGDAPVFAGFIAVEGGPESLVVDAGRGVAYTNLWSGATLAIGTKSRATVSRWQNGCRGSRGLALDAKRGFVFVGCAEGRAVSLEAGSGRQLDRLDAGEGVDIIDFDPGLSHLYLPGGKSATMAILEVSPHGKLGLLRTVATAPGGHCVVSDGAGHVFVCDPAKGRLLAFGDEPARRKK